MKIISIVGARPQFIKAVMLARELEKHKTLNHLQLHTGQHYDNQMAEVFFAELDHHPDFDLKVGSGSHAYQTGKALIGIEDILLDEKPDLVIVYGDTNATLAGALAAAKLHTPIAHVEAGLRSFNRRMPEEINRVVTDVVSDLLFCPTPTSVDNLRKEGRSKGVFHTGDILLDTLQHFLPIARKRSDVHERLELDGKKFWLLTLHRPQNVDEIEKLKNILTALIDSDHPRIIFPCHPRTAKTIQSISDQKINHIDIIPPVSYFDMLLLEEYSDLILTDSGGVQREAYFLSKPCLTLRDETEWVETLQDGWNFLTGTNPHFIKKKVETINTPQVSPDLDSFGAGKAIKQMSAQILNSLEERKS